MRTANVSQSIFARYSSIWWVHTVFIDITARLGMVVSVAGVPRIDRREARRPSPFLTQSVQCGMKREIGERPMLPPQR